MSIVYWSYQGERLFTNTAHINVDVYAIIFKGIKNGYD